MVSCQFPSRPDRGRSFQEADLSGSLHDVREEVRGLLKERGLRATAPRVAVLVLLHETAAPVSHEQVMALLPDVGFDKATIWRVLADLAEQGLLRRMDLGDRTWRYELRDACRAVADDHAHFLCEDCGNVACLPSLELRDSEGQLPAELRGTTFRVRILGQCAECVTA